ncbi:hypothetical protein ATO3_06840 [Marinibacterium profundimaris]|uniref:Response regulatory domain-containing protein n=1 Tax=Marinibacterium profundimaris TaxID=1679460 RepID=A0A225NPH6_9RHOB|nr:hypothetical protein ATO3_06840 [Marinibacterium profundimaris]
MDVLLVEDIEINRDLMVQILEGLCHLRVAVDGGQAMAAIDHRPPDVILLDLSLPVIDGWEIARRIAPEPWRGDVWVVALTAHAMSGDKEKALQAGCDDYMMKPVDDIALLRLLAGVAMQRKARDDGTADA